MAKRRTIGENPLDTVVSTPEAALESHPPKTSQTPSAQARMQERLADTRERLAAVLDRLAILGDEVGDLRSALDRLEGEIADMRLQAGMRCSCQEVMAWLREKVRKINQWPAGCR